MAEIGMEAPKMGLGEKIGSLFSRRLAEKKWMINHREQIQQFAKVAETLPEEERAKVYTKIEQDMHEATGRQLLINRAVGGVVLTAATFTGLLIGVPRFRELVGRIPKIGGVLERFGKKGFDKFGEAADKVRGKLGDAKEWLKGLGKKKEVVVEAVAAAAPAAEPSV